MNTKKTYLSEYVRLLKVYNETTNIYSKKAYDKLDFHINDSLQLATLITDTPKTVLDIGSGSGLPAIPIAIQNTQNHVIAVESKSRKSRFLKQIKAELTLSNLTIIQEDIHQAIHHLNTSIDTVTAKAFGPYDKITRIIDPLAQTGLELFIPISQLQHATLNLVLKQSELDFDLITSDGFYYQHQQF